MPYPEGKAAVLDAIKKGFLAKGAIFMWFGKDKVGTAL